MPPVSNRAMVSDVFAVAVRKQYKESESNPGSKKVGKIELFEALLSIGIAERPGNCFNVPGLLALSDNVRRNLIEDKSLGSRVDDVKVLLHALVRDERSTMPLISFSIIQHTRLDKLIIDMLSLGRHRVSSYLQSYLDAPVAESLQRLWMTRFRLRYFNIDYIRYNNLPKTGRLKDISFDSMAEDGQQLWQAKKCEALSEVEGNLQFEPGHWWLNLACAHRDGIVESVLETPTKGKYAVAALPLLTGREEVLSVSNVRYIREANLSETHVSLISLVGFPIRILRGYSLRSPLAPQAGLRYDGLYILRQYSQKQNLQSRLHRVTLTLERLKNQRPIEDVIKIPRPSQLDDWALFEKYEGETVRRECGEQRFLDWKVMKARERMEQSQWKRALEVGRALKITTLPRPIVHGQLERGGMPEFIAE